MPSPLVSIIIPVYNASQYIDDCIESLIGQSLSDIEIICVNDASTDNSLEKLKEWACKDERVKVIDSPENRRQGGARNLGLRSATGFYIGYVDADDFTSQDFYHDLVAYSGMTADVVTANLYAKYDGNEICVSQFNHLLIDKNDQDSIKKYIVAHGCRLWASIFKRTYLLKNKLFFPEKVVYEDNAIGMCFFLMANRVVVVDNKKPYYFYRISPDSVVHGAFTSQKLSDRIATSKMLMDNVRSYSLYDKYKPEIDFYFYKTFYHNTLSLLISRAPVYDKSTVRSVYNDYLKITNGFPDNPYFRSFKNIGLYKMIGKYPSIGCLIRIIKKCINR